MSEIIKTGPFEGWTDIMPITETAEKKIASLRILRTHAENDICGFQFYPARGLHSSRLHA